MRPLIWEHLDCNEACDSRLVVELGVIPIVARLLCLRGLGDPESARRFLSPSLDQLHDPFALTDMQAAVDRLLGAVARRERIAGQPGVEVGNHVG